VVACFPGCGDARYRTLAERYANLSRDYENLKCQYRDILLIHEDVCAESKLLKKGLLALQSFVSMFVFFFFLLGTLCPVLLHYVDNCECFK